MSIAALHICTCTIELSLLEDLADSFHHRCSFLDAANLTWRRNSGVPSPTYAVRSTAITGNTSDLRRYWSLASLQPILCTYGSSSRE